jgi:2-polyprenyl-3-methyl-5-hydroxy-6-metoxy-1,4-benzoquinol methylase
MNNSSGLISVPSGSVTEHVREPLSSAKRKLAADYLACPACHGPLELSADQIRCGRCSAAYPVVDDVLILVASGQDDFAQQLRARYEATSGGTSLPAVFRITRRMLGSVSGARILDVGCSQGQFALDHLLPGGARVVIGVDFSANAIREAQRRSADIANVLFVVGDAMHLPVAADRFDKIVITEVIEHLPDVGACLSELRRALAPGGEIVLSTPNYFNPVGLFKLLFDRVHHGGREKWTYADHSEQLEHFQTPFTIQRQLRAAGLTVNDFRGSDLWMGVRKAILVPWLLFDHGLRRLLNVWKRDLLSRTFLKYFGVVQYYRLRK